MEVIIIKIPIQSTKKDVKIFLNELMTILNSQNFKDDSNPPLLFVFGKSIDNKLVYIKLKIKGNTSKKILCLSFHYARHNMNFPYK